MQLCNLILRHGGSLLHTVAMRDVTPAEILILKRVHGEDAVHDIRPTRVEKVRQDKEWERLSVKYDRASTFSSTPGEEKLPMMQGMFPGAIRKLPTTLEEIGLGHLLSPKAIEAARAADRLAETDGLTDDELDDGVPSGPLDAPSFEPAVVD